ncbi:MAG: hypothetical protein BroJett040_04480 [Oligoflexia bacterium]|nr:MAG: hypothetical protein BroJett040_04480 [Oligoflexia bacterium]
MDQSNTNRQEVYFQLLSGLDELVRLYRTLLDLMVREKDILIQVDLDKIQESNQAKELLLHKIRQADAEREKHAIELTKIIGGDIRQPRLLEIAKKMKSDEAVKLKSVHTALDLLLRQITEQNNENEKYAASALNIFNGALGDIKDSLIGKKTYGKKGVMTEGAEKSGNFVSKEA